MDEFHSGQNRAISTRLKKNMSKINWLEKLNWTEEQLEDLRYTGFSYVRQGKYDIALSFFEALVAIDPKSIYDVQTLGAIYLQIGEPKKAIELFEKALPSLTENTGPMLINLAKAYFSVGRKQDGLKLASNLKENPNTSIANMAKALLLAYETT